MLKIHKSPEAENDLDEIWWYIAQDNPDSADKLPDDIERRQAGNLHGSRIWAETGTNSIPV
jgi:plasmid stabilization system protein ParE